MDLKQHLTRQIAFSRGTFGPGERMAGVVDHIGKEVREVVASGGDPAEWTDIVILALDGLTRSIAARNPLMPFDEVARAAVAHIADKQGINELRDWPDWRQAPADAAIEHVKAS